MHSLLTPSLMMPSLVMASIMVPTLRKTVARSATQLSSLRSLWEDLLARTPKSLFQRFHWNRLAADFFRKRFSPAVCAVETDAGAAIIPAVINPEANRLELLGECLFDYRDVLHTGDPEILHVAWHTLAEFGLPLSVTALESSLADETWRAFRLEEYARAPWVDAGSITEQQFRLAHTRPARQLRRMQKKGVELHQHSGSDTELIRRIYRLKCEQFREDPNNLFRDEARREFMVAVAAEEGDRCQIFTLEDGAQCIVAGLVTFVDGPMRRFYTIYFDPHWAVYSPGVALVYEVTARSLGQGLSCDYMTGEHPYKLRFATASRMLYRAEASAAELRHLVEQHDAQLRLA